MTLALLLATHGFGFTKEVGEGLFLGAIFLLIGLIAATFKRSSGKIGAGIWLLAGIVTIALTFYMGSK